MLEISITKIKTFKFNTLLKFVLKVHTNFPPHTKNILTKKNQSICHKKIKTNDIQSIKY